MGHLKRTSSGHLARDPATGHLVHDCACCEEDYECCTTGNQCSCSSTSHMIVETTAISSYSGSDCTDHIFRDGYTSPQIPHSVTTCNLWEYSSRPASPTNGDKWIYITVQNVFSWTVNLQHYQFCDPDTDGHGVDVIIEHMQVFFSDDTCCPQSLTEEFTGDAFADPMWELYSVDGSCNNSKRCGEDIGATWDVEITLYNNKCCYCEVGGEPTGIQSAHDYANDCDASDANPCKYYDGNEADCDDAP